MRAAVLRRQEAPLSIERLEVPIPGVGQVKVSMLASTICGAQIAEITGAKGADRYMPHLLGHEGCGEVLEIGPGVTKVKPGDRVVLHWRKGSGIEAPFPRYMAENGDFVGGGSVTTFNEQCLVSENRVTSIPGGVPSTVASLFGCAVTTALGLINNEAQLKIGQSIAVAGVGGVGLNIVQGACLVAASPIIAIDRVSDKLGLARIMGADFSTSETRDVKKFIPRGVDVFVDCTGSPAVIEEGLEMVAPGGKLILVGQPVHQRTLMLSNFRQHYCGKTIMDSQGGLTNPTEDIPRYIGLYLKGRLKLDHLITDSYTIDQMNEAVDRVKNGEAARIAITF